jgi:hypothetical protein
LPSAPAIRTEVGVSAELLTRREFWNRIDRGDARVVVVAVLRSWRTIAEKSGEEAIDIAEKLFVDICRFATHEATAEARLSHMVFAAYWPAVAQERDAIEVLTRWLPMEVRAPLHSVPIDAFWFAVEVSPADSSRDVFDRVAAHVDGEALPRGWDGQVG